MSIDHKFNTEDITAKKYTIPKRFRPVRPLLIKQFEQISVLGVEAYYVENFFTKAEADVYLAALLRDYPFQQEQSRVFNKDHNQPRLTRFMGDKGKSYYYAGHVREAVEWIAPALEIRDRIMKFIRVIRPDHPLLTTVLGNLYRDGSDNVGWHSDDETDLTSDAFIF